MSAWVALRRRVPIEPGQSVLVLGATGNAGTMAVQIAKRLGAGRVVGAGRDFTRLGALMSLGADEVVHLNDDAEETARALGAASAEVDIVIDYLWGRPAQETIMALLTRRSDRSRAMNWIQIGSMAGPTIELPSAALRSANFRLQGNGQGAVSTEVYLAELPSLVDEIDAGTIAVKANSRPLADVEEIWAQPDVARRADCTRALGASSGATEQSGPARCRPDVCGQHDVPAFEVAACPCIPVRPPLPSRVNEPDDCAALAGGRKGQSSMAYRHNGGKPRSQTTPAFWSCPGLRPTGRLLRSARLSTSRYNRGRLGAGNSVPGAT